MNIGAAGVHVETTKYPENAVLDGVNVGGVDDARSMPFLRDEAEEPLGWPGEEL